MSSQLRHSRRLLALALGIGLLSGSALAQNKAPAKIQLPQQVLPTGEEDAAAPAAAPAARSAVSAAAATSDNEQLVEQLLEMTKETTDGLTITQRADGGRMMDLEGQFMSVAIATPAKNGGYVLSCQTGEGAVEHAKHAHDVETGKAPKVLVKQPVSVSKPAALEEK
jgi:hypothetical protein